MAETLTDLTTFDIRFPTSLQSDGSDAMNLNPDYSAAYVTLHTSEGDFGSGFAFTIGRGNEVEIAAIKAIGRLVAGLDVDEIFSDMGAFARRLTHDSQLRWLGPEKGAMHMAIGAVVNAAWDLLAKRRNLPLWRLLSEMSPQQLVSLVDFRHLTDELSPAEALSILEQSLAGREERIQQVTELGYPAYTTSAGWLGYSDDKVARLVGEALQQGFRHLKIKVGLDIDDDIRRVSNVRSLVGPDILLSIDANQMWDVDIAIDNIHRLSASNLNWVEEPTSPDDILGFRRIAKAVHPIKLATGEHVANRVVFKQLLSSDSIQVCQIDACRVAGVNENIAIILLAAKFGVPVCPHAGGVGLCEAVQHLSIFDFVAVSGSMENRWIEYVDHLHEHFVDPVRILQGRYLVPTKPGASTEIHRASIEDFEFPKGRVWAELERGVTANVDVDSH